MGGRKSISSAWDNRDGAPAKVFSINNNEQETDPYETAPTNAYSNWNYTLDNSNNIITPNYYKGSETDVIVYANYVIGGKTYKTQIASSANSDDIRINYMFNGYGNGQIGCQKIQSIAFSRGIITRNVTNMNYMFANCRKLSSIYVSKDRWATSQAETTGMFDYCGTSSVTYK